MSVKELKLGDLTVKFDYIPMTNHKRCWLNFSTIGGLYLDHNQAHLLMLYLQEHLK